MLATISLPANSETVAWGEIPKLFAAAIQPEFPEDAPRQIVELKKVPTSAANIDRFCGAGCRPFPVSLKAEDMAALCSGAWAELPPPLLPMPEAQWLPYWEAYNRKRPRGWRLVVTHKNPSFQALILRINAETEWKTTLDKAVAQGQITPRAPSTLLPRTLPTDDCLVTVADLTQFAARFDFGVDVAKPDSPMRQDKHVPKQRKQELRVLGAINDLGYTASQLPIPAGGKAGAKSEVWDSVRAERPLFQSKKVFDLAWERLRANKEIIDEQKNPPP